MSSHYTTMNLLKSLYCNQHNQDPKGRSHAHLVNPWAVVNRLDRKSGAHKDAFHYPPAKKKTAQDQQGIYVAGKCILCARSTSTSQPAAMIRCAGSVQDRSNPGKICAINHRTGRLYGSHPAACARSHTSAICLPCLVELGLTLTQIL